MLSTKGVEHRFYFRAQLLGWLVMAWVWYSIHIYYRSASDPIRYFLAWNTMMYFSCITLTHFFLRPFYWWLSRKGWRSTIKIMTYLLGVHFFTWVLIVAEKILFWFVPVPIENFDRSALSVLMLFNLVLVTWALIYHYWTWESYQRGAVPKENLVYYVACQILGWLVVCGFWYVLYTGRGENVEIRMEFFWPWILMVFSSGIILSHVILRPFYRRLINLEAGPTAKIFLSLAIACICTMLGSLIALVWAAWSNIPAERTPEENLAGAIVSFVIFCAWSLLYSGWLTWQQKLNETTRRLKLEASYREAQMSSLKQQLNPHFIFNALNSLRALIINDQDVARKMVTEISNLLRYTLYESEKDVVPLSQEIDVVKSYLAIELLRYDGRISITWDIPDDLLPTPVVPLCVQTLVENAIKHTINQYSDGIFIRVSAAYRGSDIRIAVTNKGKIISQKSGGIGLKNTRNRLALVFGEDSTLALTQKEDEIVEAILIIPNNSASEGK